MPFDFLLTGINVILLNGLSLSAGLLIGHRLALGKDKRQEWNPIASRYREVLERQVEAAGYGNVVSGLRGGMDEVEFYLPWYRRRGLRRELERYRKAENDVSDSLRKNRCGVADREMLAELQRRAKSLLGFLKRR